MFRSVNPKSAFFCIGEESDLGRDRQRKGNRYESGMEVGEMEMQPRKRWRLGNGREEGKVDEDDEYDGEAEEGVGGVEKEEKGRLFSLNSSRIYRVSRGSGGKDRHSKVLTAKGLRDRRVRLSVSTAIQFYDLQDRLGCDQPSKAVEWLIKAAARAIAELPSLDGAFPTSPKHDEKQFDPHGGIEPTAYLQQKRRPQQHQQQMLSLTKSASSSTSETSKGSVLSLSQSESRVKESRVKARERARERTAKEKEKESSITQLQQNPNPNPQSSFTDLLNGCNNNASDTTFTTPATQNSNSKQFPYFPSMDYFGQAVILGPGKAHHASGFSGQTHFGSHPVSSLPLNILSAGVGDHSELQQFAFFQDHLIPPAAATSTTHTHNLNFSTSSSLAGLSRGTLQSNSPSSLLSHLQKFPAPAVEAQPNIPFFMGSTAASTTTADNQFLSAFDGRLQLCYGDGCRNSDLKGKGKS